MLDIINAYVYKALDAYPHDMEETMQALELALAYDERNVTALTLMGRVHAEILNDYETAIIYFELVLAEELKNLQVQSHYIKTLIWNDDIDKAIEYIDYALAIKGADKALLYLYKVYAFEKKEMYDKALEQLKIVIKHTYNNEFEEYANEVKERIKKKRFLANREPKNEYEGTSKNPKVKRFGFLF
ncbi:MAG: hypothetical protein JXQ93_11870 [Flavobacteriaceae bacterium]